METKSLALGAAGTLLLGGMVFGLALTANAENQPAPAPVSVVTTEAPQPVQEPAVTETPAPEPTQEPAPVEPVAEAPAPAPAPAEPAPVAPAPAEPVYVAPPVYAPVIVAPPAPVQPAPEITPWAPVVVDANGAANGDPNNRASKD